MNTDKVLELQGTESTLVDATLPEGASLPAINSEPYWSYEELTSPVPGPVTAVIELRRARMNRLLNHNGVSAFDSFVTYEFCRKLYVEGITPNVIIHKYKLKCTEDDFNTFAKRLGWNITRAQVTKLRADDVKALIRVAGQSVTSARVNQLWADIEENKRKLANATTDEERESYLRTQKLLDESAIKWGLNIHHNEVKAKDTKSTVNIGTMNVGTVDWAKMKSVNESADVIEAETVSEGEVKKLSEQ